MISDKQIRQHLTRDGWSVETFRTLPSTNSYLREGARGGTHAPLALVCADAQTAGRGRMGHTFFSPAGTGIYFSLLCTLPDHLVGLATVAAGVAAVEGIFEVLGVRCSIKWVNDLFVGHRKVGGILAESVPLPDGRIGVIVGIGLNLAPPAGGFPPELAQTAASLSPEPYPAEAVARLIASICERLLAVLSQPSLLERYRSYSNVLGRQLTFSHSGQEYHGRAVAIDDTGALVIEDVQGGRRTFLSGEISVLKWK